MWFGALVPAAELRLIVEESINDSISVDLGICNTGAIGNNDRAGGSRTEVGTFENHL